MQEPLIYFDNAATTPLSPETKEAMAPWLFEKFGNPSTLYSLGREARLAIEMARKTVASLLDVKPRTITFTSSGTESINTAIYNAIYARGITKIITSPLEHHAVLHAVQYYAALQHIELDMVHITPEGAVDLFDLEKKLLKSKGTCLVSLMHANNEIGVLTDMSRVGLICKKYNAIYHADCVQTVGHFPLALSDIHVDYISASGHKFHGPKGTGMLYAADGLEVKPLIHGGGQEFNKRSGTENVAGIIGFSAALETAMNRIVADREHISGIRSRCLRLLVEKIPGIQFTSPIDNSGLYTVLHFSLPAIAATEGLILYLDSKGICVSGGSACSGGHSHVMKALGLEQRINIRLSFSRYNTIEEVSRFIEILAEKVTVEKVSVQEEIS